MKKSDIYQTLQNINWGGVKSTLHFTSSEKINESLADNSFMLSSARDFCFANSFFNTYKNDRTSKKTAGYTSG